MGGEGFSVAFDPLDGSSIVDTNFTVPLSKNPFVFSFRIFLLPDMVGEGFYVGLRPLDGSSIVDTNFIGPLSNPSFNPLFEYYQILVSKARHRSLLTWAVRAIL